MKTSRTYLLILCLICGFGSLFLSCGNWEVPTKKTKRECVKPSGTLNNVTSQRKVDFSISNSGGTTDKVTWDFGNNNTAVTTGMTVSYTYPVNGTYIVKATMANTCTQETTIQQTITVSDAVKPTVTLQAVTSISTTTALSGITISSNGNAPIIKYGLCYSPTNQTPTTDDFIIQGTLPAPIGTSVPLSLTGLQPNTIYYVRSFAINEVNMVGYSTTVQTFQTGQNPIVITNGTASVGYATASINLVVQHLGNPVAKEYGIYYSSTTNNPDVNSTSAKASGPVVGVNIILNLNDLTASKTYYYRSFARTASDEIIYGPVMSFTTQADPVALDLIASIAFTDQSLVDVSGYNNHVKLVGNPTFISDRKGKTNAAILLNGSGDYFFMPDNSSLNPDALSVSIWIKPATFSGTRMQIYNKSRFADSAFETYSSLMKLENDIGPNITVITDIKQNGNCQQGKGWQDFLFTSFIEMNVWHHVVFTYSGRSARMYFDNALLYKKDDLPASAMDKCPGGDLKFGGQYLELPWYFKGGMDDIRIYKRALTASEVDVLFKQ